LEGAPSRAYWEDDNLDRLLHTSSTPKRYLISGTGDGGLIDLLRVRLRDFRHERIIQRYLRDASLGEVKTELLKLEEEFRKNRLQERDFFKKYKELPVPKELDERFQEDLRRDTTAVLNGRDASPLSARASILNRFLTSRLMRLGGVRYESGEFSVKRVKDAYEIAFLDESKHLKHVEEFDDVIVRHGPQPAIERSFKSLWERAGARMRELAELDQTRRPLFKSEHFARSPSRARVSTSAASNVVSAPAAVPTRGDCFGREELTRQLVAAVLAEEPRPTMVLGPPGIGKSTLTLQAYHHPEVSRRYGNRRYFVRLDGATSRDLMVSAVAAVLGIKSETDLWEAVKHALQAALVLLVLDNVETPWDADRAGTEALLAELRDMPGLALVCSVRGGERPYVPRSGPPIEVTRLDAEAARDLFRSIAWKVDRKDPLLERLLDEQDGLPLAIKLLALTAEGASLENTWRLWQQERAALYERSGRPDRQSSLSSSLEVSIKGPRMTEEARRLLSVLAELPGGVAQEDLDRILPGMGHGAAQVLSKVGLAFFEQGRLRMLAPIREHVRRSRPPSAEDHELMSTYYLGLPQEHGSRIGRKGGAHASTLLITEFANIEKFLEEGLDGERVTDAMNATLAMSEFMRFSGHGTPRVLQRAYAVARARSDARREAKCIESLGTIAYARSQYEEAQRRYEEALPLYKQIGDVIGQANCIQRLGDIAFDRSQHEEARRKYEEALPLHKQIGDVIGQANCIYSLGDIDRERSQHEEAQRRYEEALPLYEKIEHVLGRANCIQRLGDIAREHWQHEEAWQRYEEALPLHEQVGDVLGRANCIQSLGDIAFARSQYEEAQQRYEEALLLYEKIGHVLGRANCIRSLGDIDFARSQHEEGRRLYEQSLSLYMHIPEPYSIGQTHRQLARVAPNAEECRRHITAAQQAWESIDRPDLVQQLHDEFGDESDRGR
ncbi:tetratricopeptide repeat protein, partial [Archangium sp.]|uniref:tetratricopeptide repeat protein n=1 Tax=Archangium sp. TaxID=1872627 RepID=UPI002EDA5F3C